MKENVDLLLQRFQNQGMVYNLQSSPEQVNIVKTPAIRVAYVRNIGKYSDNKGVNHAFELVARWAKKHGLLTKDTRITGVSWDYTSLTPETMRRYDVCVQIPFKYPVTPDISMQTLPGGFYATMRTIRKPGDSTFLKWKLFDLIQSTSPKFKHYQTENNMGPWYEIFKPKKSEEHSEVIYCTHLQPRTSTLEYPQYRTNMST